MSENDLQAVLGYSVFDPFEECFEYNENACIIADSVPSADRVRRDGMGAPDQGRIEPVIFEDVMNDFGGSSGEYTMEPKVFEQFKRVAKLAGVSYHSERYDNTSWMVVRVDGTRSVD